MAPPIPRADDISQSIFLDSKERDFMKWMKTPEATKISQAAKDKAWKPFLAKYPNADRTKFVAQVNIRSSILGTGGRAKEAQSEFLVLVEDAIRQPDLAKSVQRYQLAIDQAKVRLNLAVCPGAWLMPEYRKRCWLQQPA
ncbi:hypothetical protein ACROYT_G044594 [Oculina patagonica]